MREGAGRGGGGVGCLPMYCYGGGLRIPLSWRPRSGAPGGLLGSGRLSATASRPGPCAFRFGLGLARLGARACCHRLVVHERLCAVARKLGPVRNGCGGGVAPAQAKAHRVTRGHSVKYRPRANNKLAVKTHMGDALCGGVVLSYWVRYLGRRRTSPLERTAATSRKRGACRLLGLVSV